MITWHSLKRFQKEIDQMQERMCTNTVFAKLNLHQSILMGKRDIKLLLIAARRWGWMVNSFSTVVPPDLSFLQAPSKSIDECCSTRPAEQQIERKFPRGLKKVMLNVEA